MTFCDFNMYTLLNDDVDDDELSFNSNQSIQFQKQYVLIYVPHQLDISQVSQMMVNLELQKPLRKVL